jgi:hypothetical protein
MDPVLQRKGRRDETPVFREGVMAVVKGLKHALRQRGIAAGGFQCPDNPILPCDPVAHFGKVTVGFAQSLRFHAVNFGRVSQSGIGSNPRRNFVACALHFKATEWAPA